ncbi:Ethanolamine ammonia-lyase light chain [Aquisphaera giovannonii]|uniref:Ethanolamine ammonia-lyase small subunit n=1 Tax=Aquisphaera giovannonii TaxID=406548 RepID=A0A5B9WB84_9BACT|nr:ethanolamine ammonia-lyase subunit EutC [Aquisphaera giovannonii]QEH37822.1 Ethanolamine ammonia-lyase light chain [Aquisphaera giovannonii]
MNELEPIRPHQAGPLDAPDLERLRALTPARILTGRAGGSYRTATHLELRADHAAARDAVLAGVDLAHDLGETFADRWGLFEVRTRAQTRQEFLLRPDLGRALDDASREAIRRECPAAVDLQVVLGDGLSAMAVRAQVPRLLPLLHEEALARGWRWGRPFLVHRCRVGVLNDIGEILDPAVVVLLIGERPGLATAESLSAYMAFRPRPDHDDSRRNLISNIHARGVPIPEAARRIAALAQQMMTLSTSGVAVKESGILSMPASNRKGLDTPPVLPGSRPLRKADLEA